MSLRIAAVGDIMLGDQPACFGFGVMSKAKIKGYDYFFRHVKDILSQYDVVVANLEGVVADPLPSESHNLWSMMNRGIDEAAKALKSAGFNYVSLANNHVFEHDENGLNRTIENLDQAGIMHIGTKKRPVSVYEQDHRKIGFIAWSLLPDRYWQAKDPRTYYNVTDDILDIVNNAKEVRARVDYLVLSLHWGNEFIQQPSKRQQAQAHLLVDYGIDVILGHHPHVLQPIERYKNSLIFYSLGNFVCDSWMPCCKRSLIVELDIGNELDYRIIPIIISADYVPVICREKSVAGEITESLGNMNVMDDKEYKVAVYKLRQGYRWSVVLHFVKSFFRYDKRNVLKLVKWALRRVSYILKIRKQEKERPDRIYEGPMKG